MGAAMVRPYPFNKVLAGVDWGFTNPGVILVGILDSDDRLYIVKQIYRTQQLIGWWVNNAKALAATYGIQKFVCDPSEPGHIAEFDRAGLNAVGANNDVRLGLQAVSERLRPAGDGRPRLYVVRGSLEEREPERVDKGLPCGLEEEFPVYVWDTANNRKRGEEPVKDNDHALDALRYLIAEIDQIGEEDATVTVGSWVGRRGEAA